MKLTKIDAAEAHIKTAVRLHFGGCHPVPVLTLANSAREIVASIGDKVGIETIQAKIASKLGKTLQAALVGGLVTRLSRELFQRQDDRTGYWIGDAETAA